jgi:hypothetical protein
MTVLATTLAILIPAPGIELEPPPPLPRTKPHVLIDACHAECRAWRACNHGSTVACIRRAALKYRVPEGLLLRKAWCESRMNPGAYNASSGAAGLFQFLPGTWRSTRYGRRSVWRAKWNALAAGWMHARGRGGEWNCG